MARTVSAILSLIACGCWHVSSLAEDTNGDTDADSDTDADVCSASGNWYDAAMGLCWQNPPSEDSFNGDDAMAYCDGLSLGGFNDWRLPMIQELISLIRGCVDGVETGDLSTSDCGVSDPNCLAWNCWEAACNNCDYYTGPDDDPDGCYWDPSLAGYCNCYWSSSLFAGSGSAAWYVYFNGGHVNNAVKSLTYKVRCVRGGA